MKRTLYLFGILANPGSSINKRKSEKQLGKTYSIRGIYCLLLTAHCFLTVFSQQQSTEIQTIIAEGKLLYHSEMASWHGNDIFLEKYKKDNIAGYFSYREGVFSKCIFYSNADRPRVIGTVRFDTTYNPQTAGIDLTERDFTPKENELYMLRENALDEIDADTFFKSYPNTDLDLVPLINGNQRKVYVLTASQQDSMVLLGNDYLLSFDMNNKLLAKKRLHQDLITIYFNEKDGMQAEETMHEHLPETGDLITATDICTLMLYERFTKWKMHRVNSKGFLNIWNCATDQLTVISKDRPERLTKDLVRRSRKRGDPE